MNNNLSDLNILFHEKFFAIRYNQIESRDFYLYLDSNPDTTYKSNSDGSITITWHDMYYLIHPNQWLVFVHHGLIVVTDENLQSLIDGFAASKHLENSQLEILQDIKEFLLTLNIIPMVEGNYFLGSKIISPETYQKIQKILHI